MSQRISKSRNLIRTDADLDRLVGPRPPSKEAARREPGAVGRGVANQILHDLHSRVRKAGRPTDETRRVR